MLKAQKGETYSFYKYAAVFLFVTGLVLLAFAHTGEWDVTLRMFSVALMVGAISNYRMAGFMELIEKRYAKKELKPLN